MSAEPSAADLAAVLATVIARSLTAKLATIARLLDTTVEELVAGWREPN